ncbi:60 kDa SS-A/Ro ribonucleoprotein-like [Mizuhopecten yessoensis]|uniref:60 kDa SS-A/Ro ribonucleoprotein n=1 Tax=Mizuhopecten yessoensis TaxID=6573 RepID=A0A210PMQ7_MIZYE|nr:60 kDa SS-A/Ro ribonucleoprotein-like [Mizuhopecten yessoensis]OWF37761.1 60 kDa SS-A/Ro ribonucleoprotein [Mizuhopecten yessoensis]
MADVEGGSLQPDDETHEIILQTERLSNMQVENTDGGFVFTVTDMTRLLRFLILGTEGGVYHYDEKDLKRDNILSIDRLIIQGRGEEVVKQIVQVSKAGRACKQNCTVYALAICARSNDPDTKKAAYEALSTICQIPTDLFAFIKYCEEFSAGTGWGRAHRRAIANWYNNFKDNVTTLAYKVTKFRRRHNWEHKDAIRLAHVNPESESIRLIIKYLVAGLGEAKKLQMPINADEMETWQKVYVYLEAVEKALQCTEESDVVELIKKHGLVREHVPTPLLKSVPVWQALLKDMPMNATIRNLGKMGSLQMIEEGSEEERIIVERLQNQAILKKSRIHPFKILVALKVYGKGVSEKGKLTWPRNKNVVAALEKAYYMSFDNVEPTKKRYCLAVDVSGSMDTPMMGIESMTAREGAAAMMMVTARTEPDYKVYAFCHKLEKLRIQKEDKLKNVYDKMSSLSFGSTNCSLPIIQALEDKEKFDVFIVYTDSETHYSAIHPSQALQQYRTKTGIKDARMIVVGMASTGFTIADPVDRFMMDVVGFDSNAPEAMRSFVEGQF